MLKNSKGNVIVSKYQNPGNVQCQMFKSEDAKNDWETNHTQENNPETFSLYFGNELDDAIANATAPDTTTPLGVIIEGIIDDKVLEKLKANPRQLPRARWETITYKKA